MITIDTHELAWAAGFFDGEGSVFLSHKYSRTDGRKIPIIGASIAQCGSPETLLRMQRAVAGMGKIGGPYAKKVKEHRPHWRWSVHSFEEVQASMALLWSFLSSAKREQFSNSMMGVVAFKRSLYEDRVRGTARLTWQQVLDLRADHKASRGNRKRAPKGNRAKLIAKYKLTPGTLASILSGKSYAGTKQERRIRRSPALQ